MSDVSYASECVAACLPDIWSPTMGLRVKEQGDGRFLVEQYWRNHAGGGEWRQLPCVTKEERE